MADRRFVIIVSLLYLAVCLLPNFFGLVLARERFYTGFDVNTDDMCVYMAWMEQARRGHFLFDNRFTNDEQPRLTVHLLFYVLGTVSRWTGLYHGTVLIAARVVFGFLFLCAAWRLICRVAKEPRTRRISFGVLLVSAGFGWMFRGMEGVSGPIDLWQPEGFTFTSLATNALFACALWLIVEVWLAILDAQSTWRPVLRGAACMLVLSNVHTYDVLTLCLVAIAWLSALWGAGYVSPSWIARGIAVFAGAIPGVAWIWYVRKSDPVFAARAATETFSPDPWQLMVGYLPLLILCAWAIGSRIAGNRGKRSVLLAACIPAVVYCCLVFARGFLNRPSLETERDAMFLGTEAALWFAAVFALLVVGAWAIGSVMSSEGRRRPALLLMLGWAVVSLWIPYFPALFQRKLTMGAHLPWSILAGVALAELVARLPTRVRASMAAPGLALLLLSFSNIFWLRDSLERVISDQSSTKVHPVFLRADHAEMLFWMREHLSEDMVAQDVLPYACFIPALAGQKVYAGHWSETPDFASRIRRVHSELFGLGDGSEVSPNEAASSMGIRYVLWHRPVSGVLEGYRLTEHGKTILDFPSVVLIELLEK